MNLDHFGMDTITLAGPLEAKLRAAREAGFTQIMLNATDIVGHPGGESAAVRAVRNSGLRVTGFQVLRDFEGLSGHLHAYKVDVAKAMLEMCRDLGSRVLKLSPAAHDDLVSRSSHLPHVVAAELANYVLSPAHPPEQAIVLLEALWAISPPRVN